MSGFVYGKLPETHHIQVIQSHFSSVKDPVSVENSLKKYKKVCDSKDCEHLIDYYLGLNGLSYDQKKSCEYFKGVSKSENGLRFPALLKRTKYCPADQDLFKELTEIISTSDQPRWIEFNASKAAAEVARHVSPQDFVNLASQISKQVRSRKTKAKWISEVLAFNDKIEPDVAKSLRAELYKVAPRLNPNPTNWFEVGEDALANHDVDLAIRAFEKTLRARNLPSDIRRKAMEHARRSYKAAQRKADAVRMAKKLWVWDYQNLKKAKKRRRIPLARRLLASSLTLARSLWTQHQATQARQVLKASRKYLRKWISVDEIDFLAVRIDQEEGKIPTAVSVLKNLVEKTKDPSLKELYRWNLAWSLYKSHQFKEAQTQFEMIKNEPDSTRRLQSSFWLGKSYLNQDLKQDARAVFESIINEDPINYYSLLSLRELEQPLERDTFGPLTYSTIPRKLDRAPASSSDSWVESFSWLVAAQEYELARQVLQEFFPVPNTDTEEWEEAFVKYQNAKFFAPLFSRVGRMLPTEKQKLFLEMPQTIFPRPFMALVGESAQRNGLWPEIIWALMRQESSFDPVVVSPAQAYGLMQILPKIANQLVEKNPVALWPGETIKDALLRPEINIPLGASHFRDYLNRFDGQLILAIAAYNASPEVVDRWVAQRYNGDPLIFIEDIPYEETRNYVKLVLRNFINYLRLSSEENKVPFPNWCLEGINT